MVKKASDEYLRGLRRMKTMRIKQTKQMYKDMMMLNKIWDKML